MSKHAQEVAQATVSDRGELATRAFTATSSWG